MKFVSWNTKLGKSRRGHPIRVFHQITNRNGHEGRADNGGFFVDFALRDMRTGAASDQEIPISSSRAGRAI
jgi:hypothetical protein